MSPITRDLSGLKTRSEDADRICRELQSDCLSLARTKPLFVKAAERAGISGSTANAMHAELMVESDRKYQASFKARCERSDAYLRAKFSGAEAIRTPVDRRQAFPRRAVESIHAEHVSVSIR